MGTVGGTLFFVKVATIVQLYVTAAAQIYDTAPTLYQTTLDLNTPVIVELAIVCDKEFGDFFNDYDEVLKYWKTFIWDVNRRFQTIAGANITIQISELSVMGSGKDQPFIESSRDSGTNTVDLGKALRHFGKWTRQKYQGRFDVAMAVTGASYTNFAAGKAYVAGACRSNKKQNFGVLAVTDKGDFRVGTVTHELGHLLGAVHDTEWPSYCHDRGYLMDDFEKRVGPQQFYFSRCSGQMIRNFLEGKAAVCLKTENSPGAALYQPNSDPKVTPPTIEEQCKRIMESDNAFVFNAMEYGSICQKAVCSVQQVDGTVEYMSFTPVDNSPCHVNGFCNRGKCETTEEWTSTLTLVGINAFCLVGIFLCSLLIYYVIKQRRHTRQEAANKISPSDLTYKQGNTISHGDIKIE